MHEKNVRIARALGSLCRFHIALPVTYNHFMKFCARNLASLTLVILIALTSVTMSLTRGQMRDAAGSIVLCTGTGPMTVVVDTNGDPIGPAPVCPDCTIGSLDALGATIDFPAIADIEISTAFVTEQNIWRSQNSMFKRARGPPPLS